MIEVGDIRILHCLSGNTHAIEVLLQRVQTGRPGIGLRTGIMCGRFRTSAPVVEHAAGVVDIACPLTYLQREIIILGSLETLAQASQLANE